MTTIHLLLLSALFQACCGGYVAPLYAWPLGYELPIRDVMNDTVNGNIGDISFVQGPSVFTYDACSFNGTSSSFVDMRVVDHPDLYNDHAFQFYVRIRDTDGVILDLVSDQVPISKSADSLITRMTVEVVSRNLKITFAGQNGALKNGGTQNLGQTLSLGIWYHVIIERDYSSDVIKPFIDQVKLPDVKVLEKNIPFYFPATFYVGKATDGRYLDCAVACLQIIPSKDVKKDLALYNDICKASNWPVTTTTSTTTTTTPASTTVTSVPSTTTSVDASTTTSVPSTTTATLTTTTIIAVPTTEKTTTAAYITTTTSTTTEAPSTTLVPSSVLRPSGIPKDLVVACSGFSMSALNSTFASIADVVDPIIVDDVRSCLIFCNQMAACRTFVLTATIGQSTNRTCKVGNNQSAILFENGSTMYTVK